MSLSLSKCWFIVVAVFGLTLCVAQDKPSTVMIGYETLTEVRDVTLRVVDNTRKVRVVHRTGIGNYDCSKIPPEFLTAWGYPPDVLEKEFARLEAELAAKAADAAASVAAEEAYQREMEKYRTEVLAMLEAQRQAELQAYRQKVAAELAAQKAAAEKAAAEKAAKAAAQNPLGAALDPNKMIGNVSKALKALGISTAEKGAPVEANQTVEAQVMASLQSAGMGDDLADACIVVIIKLLGAFGKPITKVEPQIAVVPEAVEVGDPIEVTGAQGLFVGIKKGLTIQEYISLAGAVMRGELLATSPIFIKKNNGARQRT